MESCKPAKREQQHRVFSLRTTDDDYNGNYSDVASTLVLLMRMTAMATVMAMAMVMMMMIMMSVGL